MGDVQVRLATDLTEDPALVGQLADCWLEVSNAGGAVGFPFPPVTSEQVDERLAAHAQTSA